MKPTKTFSMLVLCTGWTAGLLAAPVLRLTPSQVTPSLGTAFPVSVDVSDLGAAGAPSLGTYHLAVQFDSSKLSLADLSPGDPQRGNQLALDGARTVSTFVLKAPGELELFEVSLNTPAALDAGQAPSFTLGTLFFTALASGTSTVTLSVKELGDASGGRLATELANEGVTTITIPPAVASVAIDTVCFDSSEDFADVPLGDVNGVLVQEGVRFAERFAGQTLKTTNGIDSLTGAPTNPLFLVAGANGESLQHSIVLERHELGGKSAGSELQGTTAVLFDGDQSELSLELNYLRLNEILIDFYDRSGRKLDRVIARASVRTDRVAYGFRREGGVADIAGFTLQVGRDVRTFRGNGQSVSWVKFTQQPSSCPKEPLFRRGDDNASGDLDISDPIASLDYQFLGSFLPPCKDALDYDDNGEIDISDAVASLTFQFLGGPPPAPPGMASCGPDPTPDSIPGGDLGCESFPANRCP